MNTMLDNEGIVDYSNVSRPQLDW